MASFPTIFMENSGYDEYEPLDYPRYDGISWYSIYELPEEINDCDDEAIEMYSLSRDDYPMIGKALVGFLNNEQEIIRTDIKEDIQILFVF